MKFALISPNEKAETGSRIVQVVSEKFDIAEPLHFVECADDVKAETHFYEDGVFAVIPVPPESK